MTTLVLLLLLGTGVPGAAGATHSLKTFYTASSGVPNFPEFVVVGLIDDVLMLHYDSNTKRAEPRQDWMDKVTADDPEYWTWNTDNFVHDQDVFKGNIETLKKRFNQSEVRDPPDRPLSTDIGRITSLRTPAAMDQSEDMTRGSVGHTSGGHILQVMGGCQWDDETGEVTGFRLYGYNGEDFLVLDLKTETWIAPSPQAVATKHRWDHDRAWMEYNKHYYTHICPEWGRKYLGYGRSSLLRTELPSVFLLQKTPSSPVSCFATGFYPNSAALFWRRDGEELHEEVDHGEILPNHDGTFQTSVDLNLSSVAPEDWRRYDCVFQLLGVEDDLVTRLDKGKIWTNWEEPTDATPIIIIIIIIIMAAVVLVLMAAVGFKLYRRRKGEGDIHRPRPEDNPELTERLQPEVTTETEGTRQSEVATETEGTTELC
ncbi:major histocompatibility complex class I-related gene protein-like isoform X2 [Antennarius striatus]|uniref:major histocompatibility complex class I-related gene protein-like isoform X2 n=1 Tax=Antennarius striatus TaxID=241820 RepID=UPI0035AF8C64